VTSPAQLVEYHLAVMPTVSECDRRSLEQMSHLAELRHPWIDARQDVGLVVDHNEQRQRVQRDNLGPRHVAPGSHRPAAYGGPGEGLWITVPVSPPALWAPRQRCWRRRREPIAWSAPGREVGRWRGSGP
jgi:hypothetical protein